MMAENREGLGMKVIAVMVQRYGALPKELWDLNSISDMGAGRCITYDEDKVSKAMFESMTSNNRYNIINLTIKKVTHMVTLPRTLRRLTIVAREYDYSLDLPECLQALIFHEDCNYNRSMTLPPSLVELELGCAFSHPLVLPPRLRRLFFPWGSQFSFPLALPPSLVSVDFSRLYNQPITLPYGIEDICVGPAYTHDLSLPPSLRKIEWCCNRAPQFPEGVLEIEFGDGFNKPITFPSSLKKVTFLDDGYSHPLTFPPILEELEWYPSQNAALVLPERLKKLTWGSNRNVRLPLGLEELTISGNVQLHLPDGLLKVRFDYSARSHHNLPESVLEVVWSNDADHTIFTHPSTLQHLFLKREHHRSRSFSQQNSQVDVRKCSH